MMMCVLHQCICVVVVDKNIVVCDKLINIVINLANQQIVTTVI